MTRIISGKFRGKRIAAPKSLPVRPTTDMAKESLFNILNNHFYFDEISALDLFAGTGNITYELASRGCDDIIAVDSSILCTRFMEKTIDDIGFSGIYVAHSDVDFFLQKDRKKYDFIFADPPYDYNGYEELVEKVFSKSLLSEDGILVVEHHEKLSLEHLEHFDETRRYGNVRFSFFKPGTTLE